MKPETLAKLTFGAIMALLILAIGWPVSCAHAATLIINMPLPEGCVVKFSKPEADGSQVIRCGRKGAYSAPWATQRTYIELPLPWGCTDFTLTPQVNGKQTLGCK